MISAYSIVGSERAHSGLLRTIFKTFGNKTLTRLDSNHMCIGLDHVKPIIDDVIEEIKSVSILISKLAHQKDLNKTLNFSITFFDNVHCRLIVDDDQCHSTRCYLYDYEQIDDIMIIKGI